MTEGSRRAARLLERAAEHAAQPPPDSGDQQHQAQDIRNKPRNDKQNPPDNGTKSGALEMDAHRSRPWRIRRGIDPRPCGLTASGSASPSTRRGEKKANRPKPADQRRDNDECRDLRHREQQKPNKAPFDQRHRRKSRAGDVGDTAGIVYGPVQATCAGCSAQATGSVRSRAYIIAREPSSGSADCSSAGCLLTPWSRSRLPKASATCSIFTPSFSWRWRCSFSSACAACLASAPAGSGRPTIPIPPATPVRGRQRQRGRAARSRRRGAAAGAGAPVDPAGALEGHRGAGIGARDQPRRHCQSATPVSTGAFHRRRPAGL